MHNYAQTTPPSSKDSGGERREVEERKGGGGEKRGEEGWRLEGGKGTRALRVKSQLHRTWSPFTLSVTLTGGGPRPPIRPVETEAQKDCWAFGGHIASQDQETSGRSLLPPQAPVHQWELFMGAEQVRQDSGCRNDSAGSAPQARPAVT